MDSTEFNKIAGGVLAAGLLFMLLHFVSGQIYGNGESHGHEEPLAFALEIADAPDPGGAEPVVIDYGALLASADVAAGEKTYKKCSSCHKMAEGAHDGVGPSLWGVVGRDIASVDGYSFSGALTALEGDWDLTALGEFLKSPKKYASGTKMTFGGIKKDQDRVNLIVYLNKADGTPIELASAAPADEAETKDEGTTEEKSEDANSEDGKSEDAAAGDDAAKDEGATDNGASDEGAKEEDAKDEDDEKSEDEGAADDGKEADASETDGNTEDGAATTEDTTDVAATDTEAKEEDASSTEAEGTETEAKDTDGAESDGAKSDGAESAGTETESTETEGTETAAVDTDANETEAKDETGDAATHAAAFATGDADAGAKVFRKCKACHKIEEGKKGLGPSLYGIINRDIASVDGFKYSDVLTGLPGTWTATELSKFLASPKNYAKGTKMKFAGLKKETDIVNLLHYLNSLDGTPDPLQ